MFDPPLVPPTHQIMVRIGCLTRELKVTRKLLKVAVEADRVREINGRTGGSMPLPAAHAPGGTARGN